ncbi:TenA family protein [Halorubrum gandharaense]
MTDRGETTSDPSDGDRFTTALRESVADDWTAAVDHRFTHEFGDGTLDEAVFRRYVVQDYAFVGDLTAAFAAAAADAPTMDARRPYVEFLDTLTAEENDFFERAFDAVGATPADRTDPELAPPTAAFRDLLGRARHEGSYAETLAVLVPAEWVYLEWATREADDRPANARYDEWIELHAIPAFADFVGFLRSELDRVGPTLSERRQERVTELFARTVELEVAFFDAAYDSRGR